MTFLETLVAERYNRAAIIAERHTTNLRPARIAPSQLENAMRARWTADLAYERRRQRQRRSILASIGART